MRCPLCSVKTTDLVGHMRRCHPDYSTSDIEDHDDEVKDPDYTPESPNVSRFTPLSPIQGKRKMPQKSLQGKIKAPYVYQGKGKMPMKSPRGKEKGPSMTSTPVSKPQKTALSTQKKTANISAKKGSIPKGKRTTRASTGKASAIIQKARQAVKSVEELELSEEATSVRVDSSLMKQILEEVMQIKKQLASSGAPSKPEPSGETSRAEGEKRLPYSRVTKGGPKGRKRRLCIYCHVEVVHLPRHIERKHGKGQKESVDIVGQNRSVIKGYGSEVSSRKYRKCPIRKCGYEIKYLSQHLRNSHGYDAYRAQKVSRNLRYGKSNSSSEEEVSEEEEGTEANREADIEEKDTDGDDGQNEEAEEGTEANREADIEEKDTDGDDGQNEEAEEGTEANREADIEEMDVDGDDGQNEANANVKLEDEKVAVGDVYDTENVNVDEEKISRVEVVNEKVDVGDVLLVEESDQGYQEGLEDIGGHRILLRNLESGQMKTGWLVSEDSLGLAEVEVPFAGVEVPSRNQGTTKWLGMDIDTGRPLDLSLNRTEEDEIPATPLDLSQTSAEVRVLCENKDEKHVLCENTDEEYVFYEHKDEEHVLCENKDEEHMLCEHKDEEHVCENKDEEHVLCEHKDEEHVLCENKDKEDEEHVLYENTDEEHVLCENKGDEHVLCEQKDAEPLQTPPRKLKLQRRTYRFGIKSWREVPELMEYFQFLTSQQRQMSVKEAQMVCAQLLQVWDSVQRKGTIFYLNSIIDPDKIAEKWLEHIMLTRMPGTVRSYLATLRAFWQYLNLKNKLTQSKLSRLLVRREFWLKRVSLKNRLRRHELLERDTRERMPVSEMKKFKTCLALKKRVLATLQRATASEKGKLTYEQWNLVVGYIAVDLGIDNAQRAGAVMGLTLEVFANRVLEDDEYVCTVKAHKTAHIAPCYLVISKEIEKMLGLFLILRRRY